MPAQTTQPTMALQADAYTSPEIFHDELNRIFAKSWQYVGHVEQLRNPGDFFVAECAGESIIVNRTGDGTLNAMFNVCAHRAARVATGKGCKQRFSCPYHGWTYDERGQLVHAPNAGNVAGIKVEDYALSPCSVEEIHGLVFVSLNTPCKPLTESAPGLLDDLRTFAPKLPELQFAHRTEATLATNWKVAVENFSECYHCALVHRSFFSDSGSSQGGGVDADSYRIELNGLWHKHHGNAYDETNDGQLGQAKQFAGWWLWPNFAVQSHPGDIINVRQWLPVDANHTNVFVDWFLPQPPTEQDKHIFSAHANGVFAEDIPIVEMVQRGLHSRGYRGGPLMVDRDSTVLSEHAVAAIQSLWSNAMT